MVGVRCGNMVWGFERSRAKALNYGCGGGNGWGEVLHYGVGVLEGHG